jgi:hypothetical protein
MSLVTEIVFVSIALTALVVVAGTTAAAYLRYRGTRVITCPETGRAEAVRVDALHAAATSAFGDRDLRLAACSRWPVRQDCGQECLTQVEQRPGDCLVRTMLARYYEGKSCAFCRKPLDFTQVLEHKPGFLALDGSTLAWKDVPPERLPAIFSTHRPICWNCHIAATFRRQYPDLVIDVPDRPCRSFSTMSRCVRFNASHGGSERPSPNGCVVRSARPGNRNPREIAAASWIR